MSLYNSLPTCNPVDYFLLRYQYIMQNYRFALFFLYLHADLELNFQ